MSWNYRIVEEGGEYTIRDVYYNEDGQITSWGEKHQLLVDDDLESLKKIVGYIKPAMSKPIVLVEDNEFIAEIEEDNSWIGRLIGLIEEETYLATGVKYREEHASGECKMNEILELVGKVTKDERKRALKAVTEEIEEMIVTDDSVIAETPEHKFARGFLNSKLSDLKARLEQAINKN